MAVAFVVAWRQAKGHAIDRAARNLTRDKGLSRYTDGKARLAPGVFAGPGPVIGALVPGGKKPLRATWEDMLTVVAGPRTGKTTCYAVPAILDAPGPVIVTSNKCDIVDATRGAREAAASASGGRCWVFDPQGVAGAGASWWWDPLSYVTDVRSARKLAAVWANASKEPGERTDAYFDNAGQELLAQLLLAASSAGRPVSQVYRWLQDPDEEEPVKVLTGAGHELSADGLRATVHLPDRQRAGVCGTAARVASFLSDPRVLEWVEGPGGTRPQFVPDVKRHENCSGMRRINFSKRHQNCSALPSVERYDNCSGRPTSQGETTGREGSDVDGGSPGGPPVEGELLGFDVLLITARSGQGCQQIGPGVSATVPRYGYERRQGRVDQLEAGTALGQLQAGRQVEGRDVVGPVPREEVPGAPGSQERPGVLGDREAGPFGSKDDGGIGTDARPGDGKVVRVEAAEEDRGSGQRGSLDVVQAPQPRGSGPGQPGRSHRGRRRRVVQILTTTWVPATTPRPAIVAILAAASGRHRLRQHFGLHRDGRVTVGDLGERLGAHQP